MSNGIPHGKGNSLSPEPCALIPNVSACIPSTGRGHDGALLATDSCPGDACNEISGGRG